MARRVVPPASPQRAALYLVALVSVMATNAFAQERGFRLHRYDGTSALSSQFLVERPWYAPFRLAVGVTADYSLNPLKQKVATGRGLLTPIVQHAFVGHADLAATFLDRFLISGSFPVTFAERGTAETVSGISPLAVVGIGDPRVAAMVRLVGNADDDSFSLHVGADVWIPVGAAATHQGDTSLRILPRVVLAGSFIFGLIRWTVDAGFLMRPYASYGPPALGLTAASEARAGLSLGVALFDRFLTVTAESQYAMQVIGTNAFAVNGMNLELLGGAQILLFDRFRLGAAAGTALLGATGTPDARAIVRIAWQFPNPSSSSSSSPDKKTEAPEEAAVKAEAAASANDDDGDGIANGKDRCPYEAETKNGVRDDDGCPESTRPPSKKPSKVAEKTTPVAPSTPAVAQAERLDAGVAPTAAPIATPAAVVDAGTASPASIDAGINAVLLATLRDTDEDGINDDADPCPETAEDLDDFQDGDGCPEDDNDDDGIIDPEDKCPDVAETFNGVDDEDGCADSARDADNDGIADVADRCPYEPESVDGIRDDDGCPEMQEPAKATMSKLLSTPTDTPTPIVASVAAAPVPEVVDLDGDDDGVLDAADRCPVTPEDRDGFEDEDGCPEADNDDDGIVDAKDKCRDEAETVNGSKDDDGCPDVESDADGDHVDYERDRCPFERGDASDGCPHIPLPALNVDGFPGKVAATTAPTPGAPTVPVPAPEASDLDSDGVPDDADACPVSAEDVDEFEDEDGCPELDNDHDGVLDDTDRCPLVAETINGKNDDDGCPDKGAGAVAIKGNAVVIKGVVRFKTGSANLERSSMPLLKQVASTLLAAASVSVEIQGHTDDVGSATKNIKLSQRRADVIREVLIKAGVAPARLIAVGYGPTHPRATNKTAAGREKNRRVEFLILGESK